MELREIFKDRKEELKLTLSDIAEQADMAIGTLTNIMNGRTQSPSYLAIGPICRVLGVSLDAFFGIVAPGMDEHEQARVRQEYEGHKSELQSTIDLYAQQAGHQDEVIAQQDRLVRELQDRVAYQKKAVTWLRTLIFCITTYGILATFAVIILLRCLIPMIP